MRLGIDVKYTDLGRLDDDDGLLTMMKRCEVKKQKYKKLFFLVHFKVVNLL